MGTWAGGTQGAVAKQVGASMAAFSATIARAPAKALAALV
jgi:hypothetical protein